LLANWAGVKMQRSQTPYEYIHRLSQVAPAQAAALERLGDIYVRDFWADPESTDHPRRTGETAELPGLWKPLQRAFFLYMLRHPYFLRLLPASLSGLLSSVLRRERSQKAAEVRVEEDVKMEEEPL
jgi:hypothetical protein